MPDGEIEEMGGRLLRLSAIDFPFSNRLPIPHDKS